MGHVVEEKECDVSNLIYHFTSVNAALNIVSNKELWLTDLEFVNDARELISYRESFNRAARSVASSRGYGEEWLRYVGADEKVSHTCFDCLYGPGRRYVLCFTKDEDNAGMWSSCANGDGCALAFDMDALVSFLQRSVNGAGAIATVCDVVYGSPAQEGLFAREINAICERRDASTFAAWMC